MSKFGSDPHEFFESIYQDRPPWDIGALQPALADLFDAYPPSEPVLDVGCGSGDMVFALATRGVRVTGIDFVEVAIAQAQANLAAQPPEIAQLVDFQVADAIRLSGLQRQFGAVVDSGFFHVLDAEQRDRFVEELAQALRMGGRYYLLGFTVDFALPNTPHPVSDEELRDRFATDKGWQILDLQPAEFHSRIAPPVPALRACIERIPIPTQ